MKWLQAAMGSGWTSWISVPLASGRKLGDWGLRRWSILFTFMAFLLGRAMILEELFPFAIAFFAVIVYLRKDLVKWVGILLFLGASTIPGPANFIVLAEIFLFLLIHKEMTRRGRGEVSYVPFMVLMSTFPVHLTRYLLVGQLNWYNLVITIMESVLSFILTLIFFQALQVFSASKRNVMLKHEEIICLIILLASVMTGTVGWLIGDVSIEHIASRYLILLFALVGGGAIGATVGVVIGLILSLSDSNAIYQMSTLAFAGLLGGLFKDGNRLGVTLGMLLGTSILTIYLGTTEQIVISGIETTVAIALFWLTPKSLIRAVSAFVPGTQENMQSQQDYAKKVRDITAGKVKQFSEVFRQLSSSFNMMSIKTAEKQNEQVSHFMNLVSEKACLNCRKRNQCWEGQFYSTYRYLTDVMTTIEMGANLTPSDYPKDWKTHCIKTEQVYDLMQQQYDLFHHDMKWKTQLAESRLLVAEQLDGVSKVMDDLAREIQREGEAMHVQEEQIREALEGLGLSVRRVEILNLDEGNVEIEVTHQSSFGLEECRKIVAPLLTEILGENIAVIRESSYDCGDGYYTALLGSARRFDVDTGVAGAAKGGSFLSGDSFTTMELGNGKFAVAISDGMGNGERAQAESSTALQILQQLLQSGMDEALAIKSVNSILMLRSSDEVFATVDMALIDLYDADTKFVKIGSTPSFIKRGDRILTVSANNLPIGILRDIDVEMVNETLKPDDLLIMMTDGIYDAPGSEVNKELWIKRMIGEIDTKDPQQFADCLLEKIIRHQHGDIQDDMTVVVTKVQSHIPEWATFQWQGLTKIERDRSIS